jgi:hypothetical protein
MEKIKNRESSSRRFAKDKTRTAKGKSKSIKDKNTSANTSRRRHKGHIASNDPLDVDIKSLGPNSLELDEDEVEEVAAHS